MWGRGVAVWDTCTAAASPWVRTRGCVFVVFSFPRRAFSAGRPSQSGRHVAVIDEATRLQMFGIRNVPSLGQLLACLRGESHLPRLLHDEATWQRNSCVLSLRNMIPFSEILLARVQWHLNGHVHDKSASLVTSQSSG